MTNKFVPNVVDGCSGLGMSKWGKVTFALRGSVENVWHRMGNEMSADATIQEWMRAAGADFEVRSTPSYWKMPNGELVESDKNALVRIDTDPDTGAESWNQLSTVSKPWQPVQNERLFNEMQILQDLGLVEIDTAGVINEGRKVWIQGKLTDAVEMIGGGEAHGLRILLWTGHEYGQTALRCGSTSTRAVCQNTVQLADARMQALLSLNHNQTFTERQAVAAVEMAIGGQQKYCDRLNVLQETEAPVEMVEAFLRQTFPSQKEDLGFVSMTGHRVASMYAGAMKEIAPGQKSAEGLNALWQAITFNADHLVGQMGVKVNSDQQKRAWANAALGSGANQKAKAWSAINEMADEINQTRVAPVAV